jgi:hypothetical protein
VNILSQYGDEQFKNQDFINNQLVSYGNGFVLWIQNMAGGVQAPSPVTNGMKGHEDFEAECKVCGNTYAFASEQEFNNEQEKVCGAETGAGQLCPGELIPVVRT